MIAILCYLGLIGSCLFLEEQQTSGNLLFKTCCFMSMNSDQNIRSVPPKFHLNFRLSNGKITGPEIIDQGRGMKK